MYIRGEIWHFERDEVGNKAFVVAIVQSGILTMHSDDEPYYKNDDDGYIDGKCGVSINCFSNLADFSMLSGAVLTQQELSFLDLINTKTVFDNSQNYSFPGFESMNMVKTKLFHLFSRIPANTVDKCWSTAILLYNWLARAEVSELPDLTQDVPINVVDEEGSEGEDEDDGGGEENDQ